MIEFTCGQCQDALKSLADAFDKYAEHTKDCKQTPCTCGLINIRKKLSLDKKEDK